MNRVEALKILGLDANASDDEAKKKYRELSKKYHPDINKEPGAEDKFKQINIAYKAVTDPEPEPQPQFSSSHFNFEDLLREMQGQFNPNVTFRTVPPVEISITISFDESIKGCDRDVVINRTEMCTSCKGIGANFIPRVTPCAQCNGKGQVTLEQGNMKFMRTCPACFGQNKVKVACKGCNSMGGKGAKRNCKVTIPPGVDTGNVLRLSQMGNFVPNGFRSQYADAFIKINVTPDPVMKLVGNDVVSTIEVNLIDCLQGVSRKEKTVFGEVDVVIPPGSKNKEEVIIPNHGVRAHLGAHRFVINTKYPDLEKTINLLKTLEN